MGPHSPRGLRDHGRPSCRNGISSDKNERICDSGPFRFCRRKHTNIRSFPELTRSWRLRPVSSRTSRTAACSGVSPSSTIPLSSCHRITGPTFMIATSAPRFSFYRQHHLLKLVVLSGSLALARTAWAIALTRIRLHGPTDPALLDRSPQIFGPDCLACQKPRFEESGRRRPKHKRVGRHRENNRI